MKTALRTVPPPPAVAAAVAATADPDRAPSRPAAKPQPTFGMLFRFSNPVTRSDAAALLRLRRRQALGFLRKPTTGSYYFDGLILHTR